MGPTDPRLYDPNTTIEAETAARLKEASDYEPGKAAEVMQGIKEQTLVNAWQSGKRAFVSPMRVKGSYMVKPGPLVVCYAGTNTPVQAGAPASSGTEIKRLGDVKAVFQGNVLIVDPEETFTHPVTGQEIQKGKILELWAENHPEICRDAMNAETEIWAAFKQGQLNLAGKEPSIPAAIDIDKVMRGDYSGFNESNSIAARARKRLQVEAGAK